MIMMHIVAYLAIIIVNAVQFLFAYGSLKASEISAICWFVVYFFCTVIFGLIVN